MWGWTIYHEYEWGIKYIYSIDKNGEKNEKKFTGSKASLKLIQPEDMNWISIKKWNSENPTTNKPTNITTTTQQNTTTTKSTEISTTPNSVTVAYKGVDWVSQESLAGYDVGTTFVSGMGVKYTVTAIETTDSGRQKLVLETTDGTKRVINNLPAFKVDSATGIIYYDIYNY